MFVEMERMASGLWAEVVEVVAVLELSLAVQTVGSVQMLRSAQMAG